MKYVFLKIETTQYLNNSYPYPRQVSRCDRVSLTSCLPTHLDGSIFFDRCVGDNKTVIVGVQQTVMKTQIQTFNYQKEHVRACPLFKT